MSDDELPIVRRLREPMRACPFDNPEGSRVGPNDACPVCGDINDVDAPSNCTSNRDHKTRGEAAAIIAELVAALEPFAKIELGVDDPTHKGEWFRHDGDVLMTDDFRRARAAIEKARAS